MPCKIYHTKLHKRHKTHHTKQVLVMVCNLWLLFFFFVFVFISIDACIPVDLAVTSFHNSTSVTLSWIVPKDQNNTFISFVSLFSSANKTQTHNTMNKELTITELSPGTNYTVSISSLCNDTESIPSTIDVQTGNYKTSTWHWCWCFFLVTQTHNVFSQITSHKALSQKSATNESSN